jgi:hypothetical protein
MPNVFVISYVFITYHDLLCLWRVYRKCALWSLHGKTQEGEMDPVRESRLHQPVPEKVLHALSRGTQAQLQEVFDPWLQAQHQV